MFETAKVPSMYIYKSAPLTAFSSAKSTAFVVDSGLKGTSFVAVHDGFVIDKSFLKYDIGGEFMSEAVAGYLKEKKGIELHPGFASTKEYSKSEMQVGEQTSGLTNPEDGKPLLTTVYSSNEDVSKYRVTKDSLEGYTRSYIDFQMGQDLNTVKEQVLGVSHHTLADDSDNAKVDQMNMNQYELPDGQIVELGDERLRFMETLFCAKLEFDNAKSVEMND